MSILEGVKAFNLKADKPRFVIKSKSSTKNEGDSPTPIDTINASDRDVEQFLVYMITKSSRFRDFIDKKHILNETEFCDKSLFGSVCIKTILKSVLDKMLSERRLGKNLKGMNKSNLAEIENTIWSSLEREVSLYQNEKAYSRQKQQLKGQLEKRKKEIAVEIQKLQKIKQGNEKSIENEQENEQQQYNDK